MSFKMWLKGHLNVKIPSAPGSVSSGQAVRPGSIQKAQGFMEGPYLFTVKTETLLIRSDTQPPSERCIYPSDITDYPVMKCLARTYTTDQCLSAVSDLRSVFLP